MQCSSAASVSPPDGLEVEFQQQDEAPQTKGKDDVLPSTNNATFTQETRDLGQTMASTVVVHHVDYRSKAQQRKAELEALRRRHLASPQAAKLQQAEAPTQFAVDFLKTQREIFQRQRRRQQDAMNWLHQYRADDPRRMRWTQGPSCRLSNHDDNGGVRIPDAYCTTYAPHAYMTLAEMDLQAPPSTKDTFIHKDQHCNQEAWTSQEPNELVTRRTFMEICQALDALANEAAQVPLPTSSCNITLAAGTEEPNGQTERRNGPAEENHHRQIDEEEPLVGGASTHVADNASLEASTTICVTELEKDNRTHQCQEEADHQIGDPTGNESETLQPSSVSPTEPNDNPPKPENRQTKDPVLVTKETNLVEACRTDSYSNNNLMHTATQPTGYHSKNNSGVRNAMLVDANLGEPIDTLRNLASGTTALPNDQDSTSSANNNPNSRSSRSRQRRNKQPPTRESPGFFSFSSGMFATRHLYSR